MAGLASFSLVLSILWLPGAHEAVTTFLGTEIPKPTTLETVSSLAAVGLELLTGLFLVPHLPDLGAGGRSAAAAAWPGLPTLIDFAVVLPFAPPPPPPPGPPITPIP